LEKQNTMGQHFFLEGMDFAENGKVLGVTAEEGKSKGESGDAVPTVKKGKLSNRS